MLRQKCSCRNDIETRKKPKSKENIELKSAIYQKTSKRFLLKMLIYDDFSKKCHVIFKKIQKVIIASLKVSKLLDTDICTKFHIDK